MDPPGRRDDSLDGPLDLDLPKGRVVRSFVCYFGLAYGATTLLTTGLGHVVPFSAFRALVRAHGIVPARLALPVAAAVAVIELATGAVAVSLLLGLHSLERAALVFAVCGSAGCLFWLYVRRLLRGAAGAVSSCGCSPVWAPVTPASLTPSLSLMTLSLAGFAATAAGPVQPIPLGPTLLSAAWGVTLAGLVVLFPAMVPAAAR